MPANKEFEEMRKAIGILAESSLLFFRSAIDAGATVEEAERVTKAYVAAQLFGRQKPEDE